MIEVEDAISLLQARTQEQTMVGEVDLLQARGQVIATEIVAKMPVPHFPKSGMDGYAIRSQDSREACKEFPVSLRVLGEICAGDDRDFVSEAGTAVRVMTGGFIPAGYDCVIKQEDTNRNDHAFEIYRAMEPWENYSAIGEDIQKGQILIPKYTRLSSHHIGILASIGLAQVMIVRPLRVGIISTGNELAKPGTLLKPMQIYNSSAYNLAAHIQAAGLMVVFMEISEDSIDHLSNVIRNRMNKIDILLTTGAVSVGKKDIIPDTMEKIHAERLFRSVRMKPGTPVIASQYEGKIILSLSGNPFAALVNFHLFFWPMVAKAMQNESYNWKKKQATICEGEMKVSGLRRFVRAFEDEKGVHLYTRNHFSSVFSNVAESNCIVDQSQNVALKVGDMVNILYWKE